MCLLSQKICGKQRNYFVKNKINFLEKTISDMNEKIMCLEENMKQMKYNEATKEAITEKVESSKKTEDSLKVKETSASVQDQKKDSNEKEDPTDSKDKLKRIMRCLNLELRLGKI